MPQPITVSIHVAIKVCNGGFMVHASPWDPADPEELWETSLFSDEEAMLRYVSRIVRTRQGSGEKCETIGPLGVPSE